MEVKVQKVFKNDRDEDIFMLMIKFNDKKVESIAVTEKEYNDLVASLRSIDISNLK